MVCWILYVYKCTVLKSSLVFCSIDAAIDDRSLGRLANDDDVNPNAKMKYLNVQGRPHQCLFATRDIFPGEEITYNYGDADWPWRKKVQNTRKGLFGFYRTNKKISGRN